MKKIYESYEEYQDLPTKLKQIFFALSLFHSTVLERSKYGSIGWNQKYEWIQSDFNTSF